MRELKFRFWDKDLKKLIYRKPAYNDFSHPNILPLQYTGLKDKNGKDIYEGDIVKINTEINAKEKAWNTDWFFEEPEEVEQEIICKVWYNEEIACFDLETIEADLYLKNWGFYGQNEGNDLEIIGNIHENPELLTDN